jgi:uncharacterized membrane protein
MTATTQLLTPLAMMTSGLAAGGMMISALGSPLLLVLPDGRYVAMHQLLVTRFDPFMPICILSAFALDVLLAVMTGSHPVARGFFVAAAALLLGAITVSLTRNVPINKWIRTLDPDRLPPDFPRLDRRVRWHRWNLVRASFSVSALVANAVALGALL